MKPQLLKSLIVFLFFNSTFLISAKAQIVYTDIVPDITKSCTGICSQTYNLDLNGDGINDYVLTTYHSISMSWKTGIGYETSDVAITAQGSNTFVSTFGSVSILPLNNLISSGSLWNNSSSQYLKYYHRMTMGPYITNQIQGLWDNAVDKYLGVKIIAGGQIYYGWVRLNVTVSIGSALFTVKDYAYNSIPGQSILAGETSCAIPTVNLTASGPLSFCAGDSVTLTSNGTGYQYQWKKNGVYIAGATSPTYVAKAAGKYKCIGTNSCGSKTSKADTVKVPCRDATFLSMTSAGLEHLSVYPNPAINSVTIKFPSEEEGQIQIINIFGCVVETHNCASLHDATLQFDVSKYSPGIYMVRWTSGENIQSQKFSVVK